MRVGECGINPSTRPSTRAQVLPFDRLKAAGLAGWLQILAVAAFMMSADTAWPGEDEGPAPPVLLDKSESVLPTEKSDPALRNVTPGILYFDSARMHPKDPQASMVFSLLVPGLGHVYSESYLRGLLFFAVFGGSVAAIANNGRGVPDPTNPDETVFRNPSGLNLAVGVATAIYVFAAHDARGRAKAYNRKRGFRFAVTAQGPALRFEIQL